MARKYQPVTPSIDGKPRRGRPQNDDRLRISGVLLAAGPFGAEFSDALRAAAAELVSADRVAKAGEAPKRVITQRSAQDRLSRPVREAIAKDGMPLAGLPPSGRLALDALRRVQQREGEQAALNMLVEVMRLAVASGDRAVLTAVWVLVPVWIAEMGSRLPRNDAGK